MSLGRFLLSSLLKKASRGKPVAPPPATPSPDPPPGDPVADTDPPVKRATKAKTRRNGGTKQRAKCAVAKAVEPTPAQVAVVEPPPPPVVKEVARPASARTTRVRAARAPKLKPARVENDRIILPVEAVKLMQAINQTLKPKRPILENGRLLAMGKGLTYIATDLEQALRLVTKIPEEFPGVIEMFPSFVLIKALSRLKEAAHFELHEDDGFIAVVVRDKSGEVVDNRRFPIETEADDYPGDMGVPDRSEIARMVTKGLRADIDTVSVAAAADGGRYAMNGVCLDFKHDVIVATDGKRLHLVSRDEVRPEDVVGDGSAKWMDGAHTIPCNLKLKNLTDTEGRAELAIWEQQFQMRFDPLSKRGFISELEWMGQLIYGEFPPWQDVMPKEGGRIEWSIEPHEIRRIVTWIKSLGRSRDSVAVIFAFSEEGVTMTRADPRDGDASMHLDTKITIHNRRALPVTEIGLNPVLFMEAIDVNDRVHTIWIKDGKTAVLIRGDGVTNVVMPIQVV